MLLSFIKVRRHVIQVTNACDDGEGFGLAQENLRRLINESTSHIEPFNKVNNSN